MTRHITRSQAFQLHYSFVVASSLADLKCRACKTEIETHQPDSAQPERILGTCFKCGIWYLIESVADDERIMVLELPSLATIPHPPATPPRV